MPRIAAILAALTFAACQTPASTSRPQSAEPLDPFVVMIDAERWGVIIDKALEGVREEPGPSDGFIENELYRADAALKSGAARLLQLRNDVCTRGLLSGDACRIKDWPAWASEPPTDKTSIQEIDRRSRWLGEAMQPFTEVGCEAGRRAANDEMFCSVE
jgi:hypothetical protein